jgi:hypothetical protein
LAVAAAAAGLGVDHAAEQQAQNRRGRPFSNTAGTAMLRLHANLTGFGVGGVVVVFQLPYHNAQPCITDKLQQRTNAHEITN